MHPARSQSVRRWYFASLGMALALLLITRFQVIGNPDPASHLVTFATVLDTLIASVVTSLVVGVAYVKLYPGDAYPELEEVRSKDIASRISDSTRRTDEWRVKARTANYFSRVTLWELVDRSLTTGRGSIHIKVLVMDPDSEPLLRTYARYRSNRRANSPAWNSQLVRDQVYATILQLVLARSEAPRIDVDLGLSPSLWLLSLDMSNEWAYVTGQDRGDPAIAIHQSSPFYTAYRDDFEASFTDCRKLSIPYIPELNRRQIVPPLADDLATRIRNLFASFQLSPCSDHDLSRIVQLLTKEHNYAR
jgi:hypothetical protein